MYMKLKQPKQVKKLLLERKQWATVADIAKGLGLHRNTVSKCLAGKPIDAATAAAISKAIGANIGDIAEFVA